MDIDNLYGFFQGTSTIEEEKEIRAWLESSPDNVRVFNKERKLFDALLLADDRVLDSAATPTFRLQLGTVFRYAAVILLTLSGSFALQYYLQESEPIAMQTITVPAGQRINIDLPDGTNVWLNARTTIQYPITFAKGNRTIHLDGEAFFDVKKDEKHPFIVQTKKYHVEVLGTKFNIESYSDSEVFETTLMQGKVSLFSPLNRNNEIILRPNQKAYLHDGKLNIDSISDYTQYRWIEGLICFKNSEFNEVMKDFEKYYKIKIIVKNKKVRQYKYTGKFRQTDGVEYALRVLQKNISFNFRRDLNEPVIYIE